MLKMTIFSFSSSIFARFVVEYDKTISKKHTEAKMAKLYFKYGAMGSSKTAQALITKFNYEERGMKVWLIKPALDDRDGAVIIKSRIGLAAECTPIKPEDDILLFDRGVVGVAKVVRGNRVHRLALATLADVEVQRPATLVRTAPKKHVVRAKGESERP